MKIGILSKRTGNFTGEIKNWLEKLGNQVQIYTAENLLINKTLLNNDFYILKSKHLIYLYAGYYIEANNIPVIPNTDTSHRFKDRIESHFALKRIGLNTPKIYMGTSKTLKNQLKASNFPIIIKPLMGSGSRGLKIVNSKVDLTSQSNEIIYAEELIEGTHYLSYFIENDVCICEKKAYSNEHEEILQIIEDDEIKKTLFKWKQENNLLFGHLDIVRENFSNEIYIVDPGTFPEFSNWKCNNSVVMKIGNLILNRYSSMK
jgi:hypothetical protein